MITTTVPPEGRQRLANQPVVVTKSPLEQFEALEAQVQPVPVNNETLLEMMRAKKLIPGQMYRITDFITHGDAFAAADQEQPLDIIVMATGETTLSESALAMPHEGNTHFSTANVQGWQLGFTPTIDTARFPDADPLWKGLVYYVKYADGAEKAVEGYDANGPFVSYKAQTLTDSQKQQARENIDAISPEDIPQTFLVCSSAASTVAKTITAPDFVLVEGKTFSVRMVNANSADNPTLNINSTGARAIYYNGAQASSSNTWDANDVLEVYYDGTQYQCASGGGGGKFATGQKVKEVGITDELDNSHNLIESAPLNAILNDAINIGTWVIGSLGTNHEYYSMTGRIEACANIKNAVVKYTVQSGYALSIHEYSGEYTSLSDVVGSTWIRQSSSWLEGTGTYTPSNQTKTLVLILSKTPTSSMLSIQPSDASNLSVQYNTRMTLDNMREMLTEHDAEIDILEDAVMLNGNIDAAWYQGTLSVTHAYSNSSDPAPQRIITTIPAQTKFTFTVASGYSISIHEYSAVFANPTQITDGNSWLSTLGTWEEGIIEYTPSSSCKTVVVIMRKGNGTSNILPTEGSNFTGSFISSVKHSVESLQYDMEVVDTVLNGTYTEGGAYTPTWYQGTLGDNHTYVASGGNAAKRIICTVPRTNLLTVNVTSGYWASVHEYSEVFANAAAITNGSSWLGNTHGWFDGSMDITPLAATKTFVVVMSKGDKNQNVSPTDGSNVSFATEGTHTVGLIEKVNNLEYDDSDSYYWGMDMIKRKCRTTYLGMLTYLQAFCKYDGKYYSTNGSSIAEQDENFNVLRNVTCSVGHGNSLQLVSNGKAWASGWDDQKMYRVDLATLNVDQTITLPTTGYTTCAVDEDNGLMYIFQRDTNPNYIGQYTFIVYDYVNGQVISTRKIESFAAMQSVDYYQGKILMVFGLGTQTAQSGMRIYNTAGDVLATFDLEIFRTDEPEGVMFTRDTFEILVSNVGKELFRIE